MRIWTNLLGVLALSAVLTAAQRPESANYVIGPEDVLTVTVFNVAPNVGCMSASNCSNARLIDVAHPREPTDVSIDRIVIRDWSRPTFARNCFRRRGASRSAIQ